MTSKNTDALCTASLEAVAERVRSFRVLREKQLPPLCDMLGWCTWDAVYADVEAEGVLQKVLGPAGPAEGFEVVCVGHSLGAAIAAVLAS